MAGNKINVLYLINGLGSGGAERQLVELIVNLDKKIINALVVYYRHDTFYLQDLHQAGIKIFYLPKRRRDKFLIWRIYKFIKTVKNITKMNNIDIIHSYGVGANFWARIIALATGIKTIISIRSTTLVSRKNILEKLMPILRHGWWYILERYLSKYAARVIVNTAGSKEIYRQYAKRYPGRNIIVINNGFNFKKINSLNLKSKNQLRHHLGLSRARVNLAAVGRIIEQKNQICLLRAARILLARKINNWQIILVGRKSEYYEKLCKFISKYNLAQQVEFWGERQDVYEIIKASDVLVLTSLWEGMSNVVMEAMAIGTLVIVSRVSDIDRLIKDGQTGFLFDLNDENQLANQIKRVMNLSAEEAESVCRAAQRHIRDNFSIEQMVERTTGVYFDILNKQ